MPTDRNLEVTALPVAAPEQEKRVGISARALIIGLIAVTATCFVVTYSEIVVMQIQIGILQFPPAAIGLLFLIVLLNKGFRRMGARLALRGHEIMTVYVMCLAAAMVSSRGIMEKVIPILMAPNYYANPQNRWRQLMYPYIKKWMVPFDPTGKEQQPVSKLFYEGLQGGGKLPWQAWIVPLAAWSIIVLLVLFGFLCLASILRRQWSDNEKLPFPLVQLPIEMAKEQELGFFRNRLLWIGFGIPAFIFTLNGLSGLFPSIPGVSLDISINQFFVNPPWNSLQMTHALLSFAAIGFFYFLPSDVLFAIWFFFVLSRITDGMVASYGVLADGLPMYETRRWMGYQVIGCYFVLVGYYVYVGMPHFRKVAASAFRRAKGDDENEPLPYSLAFWGLIVSVLGASVWCWMAGMSLWYAVMLFVVYMLVIAVVMARSTCEAGMLMTETTFRPVDVYRMFAPASSLGAANLTVSAFLDTAFFRDQRGLMLTAFLDGFRISDGVKIRRRAFVPVFIVAILVAMVIAGYLHITIPYHRGAMTLYTYPYQANPVWALTNNAVPLNGPVPFEPTNIFFFLSGAAITVFLVVMRLTVFWWPFHPLGFALCNSWSVMVFWFPCLVTWIVKGLIIRYGGMKLYMQAKPFFLGLILGEFTLAVLWAVVSSVFGVSAPFFPWP